MEAKLKDKQAVEATVEVTVPANEVDRAFERVLRQLSREVRVPGFRPGKAPRGVLVKRIGKEALEGEVRENLIENSYSKALQQFELVPVHAHVHGGAPSEGEDFTFELHVDLYPEIALPPLDEIVIDSEVRPVDDEMVAATVARLQGENATMVPVDRPATAHDYLMVETVTEGATGDDSAGDTGGGSTMPIDLESVGEELAAQLVGKSAGEIVTLRLAGPATDAGKQGEEEAGEDDESAEATATDGGEHGDAAAGQREGQPASEGESAQAVASEDESAQTDAGEQGAAPAGQGDEQPGASEASQEPPTLTVRIKDVKEKEKPAADDEFAKTLGFETWQETEARIRESLQAQLDQEALEEQRDEFVEKLMAQASFDLPRSLVQRRRAGLLENLAEDLKRRGMTLEQYVQRLGENDGRAEFERELQEAAEKGVRRDLILERLLEQRGTRLSDAEFEAGLRQLAMEQGMDVERLRRERGDEWLRNYRFLLTRDRALREAVEERVAAQRGSQVEERVTSQQRSEIERESDEEKESASAASGNGGEEVAEDTSESTDEGHDGGAEQPNS